MGEDTTLDSNELMSRLETWFADGSVYSHLLESLIVILLLALIRFIVLRVVYNRVNDLALRYKWRKNLAYILGFVGILIIGSFWFDGITSLATFIGLLSAGLVIALRDPIVDIAAWLFILWRKPFSLGDRIQLGQHKGDVIDIRMFKFSILEIGNWVHADQSTGRVIHLPNHQVFQESIANYTSDFDFIWNEIPVVVTFESDWKRAKMLIQELVNSHLEEFVKDAESQLKKASRSYLIRYNYLTPIIYTEVVDFGIKLTIRHLSNARQRRSFNQLIWEDILEAFQDEPSIDFAYPTYRIYQNQIEGKEGTKPG